MGAGSRYLAHARRASEAVACGRFDLIVLNYAKPDVVGHIGYGQLLIIDHGEGYHTVLAGIARIDSVLGQWLLAGEPVGEMGPGSDGNPTLHVELRWNGAAINPLPWLASGARKVSG